MGITGAKSDLRQTGFEQQQLGLQGLSTVDALKNLYLNSENAYANIWADLGKPGTYDSGLLGDPTGIVNSYNSLLSGPSGAQTGLGTSSSGSTDYNSIFGPATPTPDWISSMIKYPSGTGKNSAERAKLNAEALSHLNETRPPELDPGKLKSLVEGSPQYKLASLLTAEAGQLAQGQGPLYDKLQAGLLLPIKESAASSARDVAQNLELASRAQGGAGRSGLFEALKSNNLAQISIQAGQAVSQATMMLDTWARDNARSTLAFNNEWAGGLPGIRPTFQNAMTNAANMFVSTALPYASQSFQQALQNRMLAQSLHRTSFWNQVVGGVITSVVGGLMGWLSGGPTGAIGGVVGNALKAAGGEFADVAGTVLQDIGNVFGSSTISGWGTSLSELATPALQLGSTINSIDPFASAVRSLIPDQNLTSSYRYLLPTTQGGSFQI